ncbi:centrosome-associated protein ALMS1 isoform X4 [Loxodonta africana]|uniref:centrosome-associated protein ALMS1 isoform X4 n=1 Tax=Loxodonta africana TaxID=9785 RepID=UPI0030D117EF
MFSIARGIPDRSEDTEWFSRPSEVSEALFQATSEVASDFVNSCFSVSQHPLIDGTVVESQCSLLPLEQENNEEAISSDTVDEVKTPKDSDALYAYMSLKTQEVVQQPETSLAGKDQVSFSSSSDRSDENRTTKGSDSFDASCSYMQCWKEEAFQQSETCKDHDSFSDASDTIDENEIPTGSNTSGVSCSFMPWWEQEASHCPQACPTSTDRVSFPHEVASHFNNTMSNSILHCLLERRGEDVFLTHESRYFESAYLRISAENEVKQKMHSLEGYQRNEEGLGEELSPHFEQKEAGNNLVSSGVDPKPSEIQHIGNVAVPDSSVKVSEAYILSMGHDTFKMEVPGGPLQTVKSSLGETPEQLYFQEERNRKEASTLGGKSADATENVAFEAVIASIEPSEKESMVNGIHTINRSLTNDSQEREPKNAAPPLSNYNAEKSLLDQLSHPLYQSTPGVFEPAASKPLLHKKGVEDSSLYWHPNLKSHPNATEMLTPELKSSAPLSEKPSHKQSIGLDRPQPALIEGDTGSEPFLLIGKVKSVSALDLAEKTESSDIHPLKVSTSDALILQGLKLQSSDEVADSSNYILECLQGKAESDIISLDDDTECRILDEHGVAGSERAADLLREVGLSDLGLNQSFASTLPPSVPHEPARELEYHSSDLRMLRVSPETVAKTLRRLAGDTTEGSTDGITQTNLKSGSTTTSGDSDIRSNLSLHTEALPQLIVRSAQQKTLGQHTDVFYPQTLQDSPLSEQTLEVSAVPIQANQRTEIPIVPFSSHSYGERPSTLYQQELPDSHLSEEALKALTTPVPADQNTKIARVTFSSCSHRDKPSIVYKQALSDSDLSEEALILLAAPGPGDQKTEIQTVPSSSYSHREKPSTFFHQELSGSDFTEESLKSSAVPGPPDQKPGIPTVLSSYDSQKEKPSTFYQQVLPDSHLTEEVLKKSSPVPVPADQKTGIPAVLSSYYSQREKPSTFYHQVLLNSHLTEEALKKSPPVPGQGDKKPEIPTMLSSYNSQREKPSTFYQQVLLDGHLTEEVLKSLPVPGLADQKTGVPTVPLSYYSYRERPGIFFQQTLPDSHLTKETPKSSAVPESYNQNTGIPRVSPSSYSHREKPGTFYQQVLPGSHLSEEGLRNSPVPGIPPGQKLGIQTVSSSSYSQREKPGVLYQQTLPNSHLNEQALKGSAGPGQPNQKSGIPTVPSRSHSHGEKPDTFYQQVLPDSHLTEEALRSSPVPGIPATQKTGIPIVSSGSYPQREKPGIFYQQILPDSHLTEEALRSSPVPGVPATQKTGIPIVSSSSYPQREKPGIFYQQTLPDSHLTEEGLKGSAVAGQPDQKSDIPAVPSRSYSPREKPDIFYQQTLPDSHLAEEALRSSPVPGIPATQKTGIPTVSSSSYPQRKKPGIFFRETLPDSKITEEALKGSSCPRQPDQKSGIPTVPSSSYSPREKSGAFYKRVLPDGHLTEQALRSSPVPGILPGQKLGIQTVSSGSYSQGEKPGVFYQQRLPDSHLNEQALKSSAGPKRAEQKSGIPTLPFSSHSHGEKPDTVYQQTLPGSHLTEEALRSSPVPIIPATQKTAVPTVSSSSYPQREKPGVFYQQTLPDSHITEETLKGSAGPGRPDQMSGTPIAPSSSYSPREKPDTFYQQVLPDSHLTEEALSSPVPVIPATQKTGIPTVSSSSYPQREKPGVFYLQTLPDSHQNKQALKGSAGHGPFDQKSGIPTVPSSSHSHGEKPDTFYQQVLPDSHLTEEALRSSPVPGIPATQKTGIPTLSSSFSPQKEEPGVFYQQTLPDSHLTEEALKGPAGPGRRDQKSGKATVPSSSHSHRENPSTFYQQALPDSHLTEQALESSLVPGIPADQKTGIPRVPSSFHSHREKPDVFYQQVLPDSHLTEDALRSSPVPVIPADQKAEIPVLSSSSYPQREKPGVFYQQVLPSSHLTEEALRSSPVPGIPADQKAEIPAPSSSFYPQREKPGVFYQQALPDSHITEETLKILPVSGPADQKTGIPTVPSSSYLDREKPGTFYQQELPDSHLTELALKSSPVPGPTDQKTGIETVSSSSYPQKEKPGVFYQQTLTDSHLTEEAVKVLALPGPAARKTGIPTVPSSSYSHKEKPSTLSQQELPDPHHTDEPLKVLTVLEPADQKTQIATVLCTSCSHKEKPGTSHQQTLPDSHLTEEGLKDSPVPGPADQKTGIPIVPSNSYSHREKSGVFYQQELSVSDLTEETLKVLAVPGPADQKSGISTVPSSLYSQREAPGIFYQQVLPESHLSEGSLKSSDVPGPADQQTGIPTLLSSSFSPKETPGTFYQQNFPDSHLTEEAPEVSTVPGPADQKTGLLITPTSSSSHRVKRKISPITGSNDQKTESPTTPTNSNSHREKPKISTVIGPDDQKTTFLTVFSSSYSQRIKPSIFSQQELPDRHKTEDNLKVSTVPKPPDGNTGIPIPLTSSYTQTEISDFFYPSELSDRRLTDDIPKVSTIPGPGDQKTVLPTVPPSSVSHREKPSIFSEKGLPDRHVTEDILKVSSALGQVEQITVLPTAPPGIYLHSEKHKVVSEHAQKLVDNFNSSDLSVRSKNMPINSQVEDRVVINKPETLGFRDLGSEETRNINSGSKTLKEIQTLLMEAEKIALRRCKIPAPLIPFRDVGDISCMQSKKVVCFKEPVTTDECSGNLCQKEPLAEENPSNSCIQKDISTQTNLKCQRGIENWEFISSTTVRSPLQEAEHKARVASEETLKQYETAKSVTRSEPEGCSGTIGNKIVIPVVTIVKSDSSSDTSDGHGSCSWDSNLPESLESASDVLLNFFPDVSPNASITDSREEEGVSESDDGGSSSVDSLAAHVKNLLQCESSLNHAKQILRNAEEEESRVRAQAWNLKFNLAHECGYSISELNEDDRRKVEEIKAKLFGHGRTSDSSQGLQSPRGIGCKPEAVCSHIIIESHEKGCLRTLTSRQTQLDSHPCVFRSDEPEEMIRGQQGPSSWRARHISLSESLDQNNPRFKVWNSLQLRSHSPYQNFIANNFNISKDFRVPFREKMDPWSSELVDPARGPPEEMDFHSSSQMLPPEPMRKFTTSITFSSHRHSKCISDSSVFKVGVTEGSTGASVGVFNSHFTEEQNLSRDQKEKTSSPSSVKMYSHSPDKDRTVLQESDRQNQKLHVDFEHSHQEEKLLEIPDFKVSHSEPSPSANCSNFISKGRANSTLGVKEKNATVTPDLPSLIFLEQRQLFEQCKAPHADHHMRKHHSPPPQHQDYVAPDLPSRIFLEQRELFEQSKASHVAYQMRENHSHLPQGQDCIALDLPSDIFLEQRELFEQSKDPCVDHHVRKHHSPFPEEEECVVEKDNQHKPESHISDMVNVEAKFNNVISQSFPNYCTPPSNRRALSCVRITLSPKTPSKLDSGTLDKRLHSLDPVCESRMNIEFNSELQTISSRSLEPTSEYKSSLDVHGVHFPLTDSSAITQDLKNKPSQNSQIVTSRQTQVNISDLEGYFNPEGTPVSAHRPPEEIRTPSSAVSGRLSSDAVTQITTESPEKTSFSSEIFINTEDRGRKIPESHPQQVYKVPIKFASSSSVQQITTSRGTDAQPSLLPYKPSGSTKMYYVPQLEKIPQLPDTKSDTTLESSHSGSNDAIAPDFPAQVLGTRDDNLSDTVSIKHKEGIYSKRAVTKPSWSGGEKPFQKDTAVQVSITGDEDLADKKLTTPPEEKGSAGCSAAAEHSATVQDRKIENLPDIKAIKQKEEICSKRTVPKTAWTKETESLQIDTAESRCHSEFENTTHSVFRSAQFYFHHPVHLPNEQDFCHESLGRGVFMRHSWKDVFQHHPDKHKELSCLSPPYPTVDKTKMDYTRIESLRINVNLENKDVMHTTKSQARDHLKCNRQINDVKRDHKASPEPTTQGTVSLNELWNRYQERQRQQKPPEFGDRKELSLVERLDRLAKLLQNPITHCLQASESTHDDSREERGVKEWSSRQQQQKNKLQKKKRYKGLEKCHKNIGDLKKPEVLSAHQAEEPNQIKFEHIKFNKYILRKQAGFNPVSNTSSDSRPSESELFTDTTTNVFSTTTSPMESEYLTQTDKEVATQERSSSISTIDTARLVQAFGHERVCLSPRRIKLYSTVTSQQRRCLEKRCKQSKKAVNTGHFHVTAEHTGRKNIQVGEHMISSDSLSSSASSFWSSSPILCSKQNVQMLNKGVQAGNLEIVNGARKHTRDVGVTFPTPSSSEARLEDDSDVSSSLSEGKNEEKTFPASYPLDKKLRKNKSNFCEGISWFVPVENLKSGPRKENLLKSYGPGISWFEPITNTKPWREPLREKNWQGQWMDCRVDFRGCLADPCRGDHPLRPLVRASLQESLQFHRPDFISRSGERIKRLKLIVQERKLQNVLQSERDALFNTGRDCQGCQDHMRPPPRQGFPAAQKSRPVGKKEMIQRSKRMYEQLPEVQKRKEEEKRKSEYKSYRLRAQLYKKKVTNQLLGRKVPWD